MSEMCALLHRQGTPVTGSVPGAGLRTGKSVDDFCYLVVVGSISSAEKLADQSKKIFNGPAQLRRGFATLDAKLTYTRPDTTIRRNRCQIGSWPSRLCLQPPRPVQARLSLSLSSARGSNLRGVPSANAIHHAKEQCHQQRERHSQS